jgi:hypothetical protein
MTPAESGRAGLGDGEVFVEMHDKKQLPCFCFLGGAELATGGAKTRDFANKSTKTIDIGESRVANL